MGEQVLQVQFQLRLETCEVVQEIEWERFLDSLSQEWFFFGKERIVGWNARSGTVRQACSPRGSAPTSKLHNKQPFGRDKGQGDQMLVCQTIAFHAVGLIP